MVTHTFSFWPSRDPAPSIPLSNPASRFRWALLEFPVEFCYFEFEHVLFFVSIFGFSCLPTPPSLSLQFSSVFSLVFFWFLSICSTRTVPPPEPQPRWKLTSFCFRWDHSAPTARERLQTPPPPTKRSKSFLSGSSYVYVCVCVCLWKRGGTAAAERSRFFKYDINKRKKAEEEENSYLLVHKWRKTRKLLIFRWKIKQQFHATNNNNNSKRSWTKSKRLK